MAEKDWVARLSEPIIMTNEVYVQRMRLLAEQMKAEAEVRLVQARKFLVVRMQVPTTCASHQAAAVETARDEEQIVSTLPDVSPHVVVIEGSSQRTLRRLSVSLLDRQAGNGTI